ncbi:YicC/YloC family endoribonuclease [Geobacter sp. DSM 9736]|uniref:YicC/YloC family endoribonuclease n=1 Tax=Geobacter sp. DSM 9736 TaxID=1277350 RepID=UPI000B5012D8|nr:YicC/YloC family endoribonuclease [Geobacter sp. DSM 9736]SNB45071.1 TIGR00255 family protein [Geobacter sp. DSM 9736]
MVKSMTGYGKAETSSSVGKLTVEIRTVNHRYGEVSVKLPRTLLSCENVVRKAVFERLKRGKIEVSIQQEASPGAGIVLEPDIELARGYAEAFRKLQSSLGIEGPIPLSLIVSQRDVLNPREISSAAEDLELNLLAAVQQAVDSVDKMRIREGNALVQDLEERRKGLNLLIAGIEERAPLIVAEHAARLRERVRQMLGDLQVDEMRLAQEVALLADKSDVTEELVRFRSHLQQFDETLLLDEPVGRKLDFLMQELNREVNTIGSKANDGEMAAVVVQIKAELERIREQVQNIE